MASPRLDTTVQVMAAKRDALLELARQYAFGCASEDDVVDAAKAYGEAWLACPARTQRKEEGS